MQVPHTFSDHMDLRGHLAFLVGLVGIIGIAGCDPDMPPPDYETPNMRIYTNFEAPLCAGDLEDLEGFIESVEQTLGVSMHSTVDVYLWNEVYVPEGQGCRKAQPGCYRAKEHSVYTTFISVHHELVHAVVGDFGRPNDFFTEGIASAMEPRSTRFLGADPSVLLGLESEDTGSYARQAHFSRWLLETHGAAKWRELYQTTGSQRAFEKVYGVSFAEAVDEYFITSLWSYPQEYRRALPALPEAEVGWRDDVDFDCSTSAAFGGPESTSMLRVLDLQESGLYDIWTSADFVSVRRRTKHSISTKEEAEAAGDSDVPGSTSISPFGSSVVIPGGTVGVLQLDADEYEVALIDLDRDLDEATVVLVPHLGPIPHVPGAL